MLARCLSCECALIDTISLPTSPAPGCLRTNIFPSFAEAVAIRGTLLAVHSDISQLDHEIARLQTTLQRISVKREAFHKFASEHESFLSPIRRLPPELLAEVFMNRLPAELSPTRDENDNIMVLSHVCKHWRDVALTTPMLWSAMSTHKITSQNFQSKISLADIWLTRLRQPSLSYLLSGSEGLDTTKLMADFVLPRCRHAELRVVSLPPRLGPLPNLKSLDIHSRRQNFDPFTRESPLILESPAVLRDVRLTGIIPYQIQLPWSQLTEFRVRHCNIYQCLEALGWMANLVTLEITPKITSDTQTRPRLIHLRLKTLKIFASFDAADLCDYLTLPSLRAFEYCGASSGFSVQSPIASLISRSTSHLQELGLANCIPFEDEYLIQVLEHTPELHMLRVESSRHRRIGPCLLQMTYRGPHSPCLVPKLRKCTLRYTNDTDFVAFADMVESRWRIEDTSLRLVSRLEEVHLMGVLGGKETLDSAVLDRFNEFIAEGLMLKISA